MLTLINKEASFAMQFSSTDLLNKCIFNVVKRHPYPKASSTTAVLPKHFSSLNAL